MKNAAWVLTVDMGYGHQRAAYPLKDIANMRILNINTDSIIPEKERKVWLHVQRYYEWISRMKDVPLIGGFLFGVYGRFQSISPLFPIRDLSKPSFGAKLVKRIIFKKKLCEELALMISKTRQPVITTFFGIALALDYRKIKNKIYCVVTDSDINRAWVSCNPRKSKIIFLAPCKHIVLRLKQYGVPDNKIIMTGFPLPKENIGGTKEKLLKKDILNRISNLDPKNVFSKKNHPLIRKYLSGNVPDKSDHILTICYLVGGAGAQKENGIHIARSLKDKIMKNKVALSLVAGTRRDVFDYYERRIEKIGLKSRLGQNLKIIYSDDKTNYFKLLNMYLRKTDIIWTKPSEMSFYTGLGLPILMTNPLGAHEDYNKEWLEHLGGGIMEQDPRYCNDWLYYWLENGRLAEAAFAGYLEALTLGTYNIEDVVLKNVRKSFFEK